MKDEYNMSCVKQELIAQNLKWMVDFCTSLRFLHCKKMLCVSQYNLISAEMLRQAALKG